jgi:methionine--tRNA ligase beta chain
MITFEDFKKLEIKIGTVKSAEKVPDTDKLLRIIFDLGEEERQVIAGIAEFYPDTEALIGKQMPIVTNLEPRKLRGLESQGMIMAVDVEGKAILLHPDQQVPPGSIIR